MRLLSLLRSARLPACLGLAAQPQWTRAGATMLAAHIAAATWGFRTIRSQEDQR